MSRGREAFRLASLLLAMLLPIAALAPTRASEIAECCADLDEKAAELESMVLRKGVSNASLQIYGQVNRAILFWNDGFDSRSRVVDNTTSSSRLGFIGQSKIRAGLAAGYRIELEFLFPASSEIFNPADVTHAQPLTNTAVRQVYGFVSDERVGSLSLGYQWSATGNLTIINLGSQMNDAALHYNNGFSLGLSLFGGIFSDLKWGQIAHSVDTLRGSYLRYDTPLLHGFVLSASAGEKDSWDVALRYQADGRAFRFAGGVGYRDDRDNLLREVKGAASLLHNGTGLYVSLAGGLRDDALSSIIGQPPSYFYYGQAGVSKNWLSFGNTTVYADFGVYRNFNVGELLRVDPHTGQLAIWGTLAETEVVRWGYGVEQAVDEAGLLLYAQAHHYGARVSAFPAILIPVSSPISAAAIPITWWRCRCGHGPATWSGREFVSERMRKVTRAPVPDRSTSTQLTWVSANSRVSAPARPAAAAPRCW